MIRRFNYTNRKKISKDYVFISLLGDRSDRYFNVKLELEGFGFPADSRIYIEAYYKDVKQRFSFGTIDNIREPSTTRLAELPETNFVYFNVLVVDESASIGRILGIAKGILVGSDPQPNDRIPLLPVNPTNLRNQIWRVSFEPGSDDSPILEINNNIPDILDSTKNNPNFITLVFPMAFRIVLHQIVKRAEENPSEDSWVFNWYRFINEVLGIKRIPEFSQNDDINSEDAEEWIDDCVNEFCNKLKVYEKFVSI